MRKIKILSILFLSFFVLMALGNMANAETIKGEEILKEEIADKPSEEFKKVTNSKLQARYVDPNATTYTSGNYQYQIKENYRITANDVNNIIISDHREDIAVITKYTGNESTVTIPSKLGGKRVYEIEEAAFYQNTSIQKLIIPNNTVGYIGEGAFADCTNLREVSLGNSVKNISYYAFQNTAITTLKLPTSLEAVRSTTFFHCKNLTNITVDSKNVHYKCIDSVIYEMDATGNMELTVYPYAKKDKTFTVPNKVKSIGREAIINDYIETINIPATVNNIETSTYAFTTPNLKNINVDSGNTAYSSINGVLFSKDKKKIIVYPAGRTATTYSIPNGTTIIETDAFYNTNYLKHIDIPNTVTKIETEGFGYAKGLEDITIPSSVKEFGAQLFRECPNLKKATISANAELLSYLTFRECENLEEVVVNGNIKTIIKGAFYYCPKLTKVTLPDSLETIKYGAFWDCRGLKNITIPKNVVVIEDCGFYEHTNPSKDYWADTNLDISQTNLKKQADGSYRNVYDYSVKGTRDYTKSYEVLALVNQERKKAGLKELTMDKDLLETAMKRATEIVVYYDHERPNGTLFNTAITQSWLSSGENIAIYQPTAAIVMNSWMNSQGHRENILTANYTSIGIGCYKADNGEYYWTQVFTDGTPTTVAKPQNKNTTETIKVLANRIPFNDVSYKAWYYNAVKYNVINKTILGYNSTTFAPNKNLTRGMIATILFRMDGAKKVTGGKSFPDVKQGEYYYEAIKWATSKGIVNGYKNGKFGPNDNVTREQLATMLYSYAKYKGKNVSSSTNISGYNDSYKVTGYAKPALQWAIGKGIISGKDNGRRLDPQGTATRAEAATMIYSYCTKIK